MTPYKKVPAGTTVEVAEGTVLPVDGFGTVEVDLDQPGATTKPVKIVSVCMCQNFRGTCCPPIKQWSNARSRSSATKPRLFWGSWGRNRLFFTSTPTSDCYPQQVCDGPRVCSAGVDRKNA